MMDAERWVTLGTNLGTQAIIVYAIDRGARLLQQLTFNQRDRQKQWMDIQRDVEMLKIRQGSGLLGPREVRLTGSPALSAEVPSTPPPAEFIG